MANLITLSLKHKKFCKEFIKNDRNGTQAYMTAFEVKNPRSAARCATRLLKRKEIDEYINLLDSDFGFIDNVIEDELRSLIQQDEDKQVKLRAINSFLKHKEKSGLARKPRTVIFGGPPSPFIKRDPDKESQDN